MDFLMKYGIDYLNEDLDVIKTPGALSLEEEDYNIKRINNSEIRREIGEIFKNFTVQSKNVWVLFIVLVLAPIFMMFKSIQDKDVSFTNKILFTGAAIGHCILTSKVIHQF